MSILFTEYNEDIAKRVYGEELVEDTKEDIAKSMLQDNFPVNVIAKHTGLSEATIRGLWVNVKKEPVFVG